MRLVEEEHELGLVEIAGLGQALEQLGQQPEQEGRIQRRLLVELVGREDVDDAAAGHVLTQQIVEIERRLAEEVLGAIGLQRDQPTLDRADRGLADQAVVGAERLRVVGDEVQRRLEVLEVEQQQAAVVAILEHELQHGFLHVGEPEQAREQQRPHVGHGAAHRMSLRAEDIPEHNRVDRRLIVRKPDLRGALDQLRLGLAGHRQAGQIALDVGREHRHAEIRETLAKPLQRDRLAGAGGAGDQAVAIAVLREQPLRRAVGAGALADEYVGVHGLRTRKGGDRYLRGSRRERQCMRLSAGRLRRIRCARSPPRPADRSRRRAESASSASA